MIKNSKQDWSTGNTVKVGFQTLRVVTAIAAIGDGMPGAYVMLNLAGTQFYSFVPHNGLTKISADEAVEMCEEGKRNAAAVEAKAAAVAQRARENAAVCARLMDLAA